MTSIPIKKHASSIAHRDFSLCLSLYSDASIPFLKRKWSRKRTAQHAGIGRVSTALGTATLWTWLSQERVCLASTRVCSTPEPMCKHQTLGMPL